MRVKPITRRQLLSSATLVTGTSMLTGCGGFAESAAGPETTPVPEGARAPQPALPSSEVWAYIKLDPAVVAAEAYRLMPQGGCMYALFGGIVTTMAQLQGEPYRSFPVHMMKYGEGGVGLWGTLCGTLNGGAAIIGLFVPEKEPRDRLIAELFSWYEATELPTYHPKDAKDSSPFPRSVARSVLCHVSLGRWCAASGNKIGSPEMKERCRRLTAEVAAKTVELLNQ